MEANTREGSMTDKWVEAAREIARPMLEMAAMPVNEKPYAQALAIALRSVYKAGQEDMRERAAADVTTQAAAGTYSVKAAAKMTAARIRSLPLKES